jgi:precorrin-3B C17-methyltransferase
VVEARLRAAAAAGFVLALYNPASRARPWQLGRAFEVLGAVLPGGTAVVFGRAALRADERIEVTTLAAADPGRADMATCVIIGSAETKVVPRPGLAPLVYTPRAAGSAAR